MAQGIERFSAPPPGEEFDPTGEAQFRRLIEQFMENADYRVRDVGDDVLDHESRIAALEGAADAGSWRHIETQEITSAVATVDFTGFLDAAFRDYVFVLSDVVPATDAVIGQIRTSSDGGSTWDSGASDYQVDSDDVSNTAVSEVQFTGTTAVGSATDEPGVSARVFLFAPAEAQPTSFSFHTTYTNSSDTLRDLNGSGRRNAAEDVDGVRFLFSSGNVESGQISLYGIKDS